MFLFSSFVRIYALVLPAILLLQVGDKTAAYGVSQAEASSEGRQIGVLVWTDRAKYSLRDAIRVNAALQNTGDETTYVDRRMSWTGYGGGLELEIRNEQGKPLPSKVLSDLLMPPPEEGDTSILIRLDQGCLYGSYLHLEVKDFFPKPGRYSLRVTYKSWLRKESVLSHFQDLPALWADSPEITSKPVWIEVVSKGKRERR